MSKIAQVHFLVLARVSVEHVKTDKAPVAIGPYSQGVIANGFFFSAGQIALDPVTGQMVESDISKQTERVLENLAAVLAAAGLGWGDVVRTTVYLHDMAHFPTVNEIYARIMGDARPARSTVQVTALPRGSLVEIDLVAATK
ncbi:MAG TPA: Rid family detoxifying hydrolase [Gemmatimonadaceae bacterium]|nr:Rid family detoxifying hydrolase [Gemmatimonadaceae bacterium]